MNAGTGGKSSAKRLGDFEIVRELGRGGMGIVYEARQVSLNRKVALKVVMSALGLTSKAVIRFRREAEAAARLHHTNIVPIYATGEEDGQHYYAMELVEGPSVDKVIGCLRRQSGGEDERQQHCESLPVWASATLSFDAAESVPPSESQTSDTASTTLGAGKGYFDTVARMIAEVADALDYAHAHSVIHRDIKPSNLLLSPEGRLSINDFGLARMLEQPGMTTTGEFMGSPLYMSPEQIAAGRVPLDHKTDIYSLGATLYEMLTLEPPFHGERRDQVLAQILHKEPRRPRKVNRKVPLDLETICLKAMEKDPEKRYKSAGDMAEDLRRFVNRFAIAARRAGLIERGVKWTKRHQPLAAALACVMLLAMIAAGMGYQARAARLQLRTEQRQNALDRALQAAMLGKLAESSHAIDDAELLGASPGQVRLLRGQVAFINAEYDDAIRHLEVAIKLLPEADTVGARGMLAASHILGFRNWGDFEKTYQEMARLTPKTPEDFLFRGAADTFINPQRGLPFLDESIRRKDSPMARATRAWVRADSVMETADPRAAQAAVEDAAVARSMLPDSPFVLCRTIFTELDAVIVFSGAGDTQRAQLAMSRARDDERALSRPPADAMTEPLIMRWGYFQRVGDDAAAFDVLSQGVDKTDSGQVAGYYALGLYQRGQSAEAIRVLERRSRVRSEFNEMARVIILLDLPDRRAEARQAISAWGLRGTFLGAYCEVECLLLAGDRDGAAAASASALQRFKVGHPGVRDNWIAMLDYFRGGRPEAAVLAEAGRSFRDQCEAHYSIALQRLASGDRVGAVEHFRKVIATGPFYYEEYAYCRAILGRMEADPAWPRWMPAARQLSPSTAPTTAPHVP